MAAQPMDPQTAGDTETEAHLLSYLLDDARRIDGVRDRITPAHFSEPHFGWLYGTILDWHAAGKPITLPTLIRHYEDAIKDSGLARSLIETMGSPLFNMGAQRFPDTAEAVFQAGGVRIMQTALGKLATGSFDTTRALSAEVDHLTATTAGGGDDAAYSRTAGEAATDVIAQAIAARNGEAPGLKCHFLPSLPSMAPSDMVVLAARPSMGKSALATNIARGVSEDGVGVVLFSLEMSADQQVRRIVAEMSLGGPSPISHDMIREGRLSDAHLREMALCQSALSKRPLYFHDRGGMTLAQIRHWTRIYRGLCEERGTPLGLVIVDYLQLITNPKSQGNRVSDVTIVSQGLKALAKDMKVPVLALSQLSRKVEERDDKRPMLSDLRESGAIEQDADAVWMLFREEYYLEREKPKPGKEADHDAHLAAVRGLAEVNVAKNRHGRVETIRMEWNGPHQAFREGRV